MRLFPFTPLAAAAIVAFAGPATAHARLISATPAPDSMVGPTRTLTLVFSERSVPAFSGFDVYDANGAKVQMRPSISEDGKTLSGTLARPLAAGTYRVEWRLASIDGHRMTGAYTFMVH